MEEGGLPTAPVTKLRLCDLIDISSVATDAVNAILDDRIGRCFKSNPPISWKSSLYLFPLWCCGLIVRYLVLFPIRIGVIMIGLAIHVLLLITLQYIFRDNEKMRKWIKMVLVKSTCGVFVAALGCVVKYHGTRPKIHPNQVFVANHTSMVDVMILEQITPFAIIMQKHSGWPGLLQKTVLNDIGCVSFNRTDAKDREFVGRRLREHVQGNININPILIFPEGTCVNNKYILTFLKGAFEAGCTVFPIAIKYNNMFVDPFWDSRKVPFTKHLLGMMTSWAVICDVWYMEPQRQRDGETSIEFAERVRDLIADRAGLEKVPVEGYLKHSRPKPKHKLQRQREYTEFTMQKN